MTDLEARADRVRAVVQGHHGKVIRRIGDTIEIEVPADIAIGLSSLWGEGGFLAIYQGQSVRLAPRRVTDMQWNIVVCHGDLVTTPFYRYHIDLVPQRVRMPAPTPETITRQTSAVVSA
jgi:hypothetical protein